MSIGPIVRLTDGRATTSKQKVLTKEIAAKFIKGDGLNLNGFIKIENDAANILSKHKGDLYLSGLTELSDAAAKSLSKHEGDLCLNGLTELSDAAEESLSKHKGQVSIRR